MSARRPALLALSLLVLAAGCQGSGVRGGRAASSRLASTITTAPAEAARPAALRSLVAATTPHSRAAATALAAAALAGVTFPPSSTRLTTRPPLGTADLDQERAYEIVSRARRIQWWSVPGSVADLAGYLAAHPPQGLRVSTQGSLYVWSAAIPLAFDMDAYLVQDGADVIVSLEAEATWTPPKTAVETIPATVTSAVLDYTSQRFGADRRLTVSGSALADIRAGVNAMETRADEPAPSCPEVRDGSITLAYGGHAVVLTSDSGCRWLSVTSDGRAQPLLWAGADRSYGVMIDALARLAASAPKGLVPRQFRGRIVTAKAADARAVSLLDGLTLPSGTTQVGPPEGGQPLYEDRNQDYLVRSRWIHVAVTDKALLTYLVRHVPAGLVVAHLDPSSRYGAQLVEQLAGAQPSPATLTVTVWGGHVVQLAAGAQWSASRSPAEHIPASVRSALLTFEPQGQVRTVAARRVQYSGAGLGALIRWLNTRQAADPYGTCRTPYPADPYKLGVTVHAGSRVVTFYWGAGDCTAVALVNGGRAPALDDPPTALVERLLQLHLPS